MLKTIKLKSIDHDGLGYGDGDWEVDSNGNLKYLEGPQAVEQNVVKMIHTRLQSWGYGTVLHDLIGSKNKSATVAAALYSAKKGLEFLAWIQARHTQLQAMELSERLGKELRVIAEPSDQSIILTATIETADGAGQEVGAVVEE